MKTKTPHVLTLGAALLLAPLTSTLAQSTWQTTDALTPYRGRAIVADAAGNFISLAIDDSTSSTGPVTTAVSLSSDTGLTWQTVGLIPGYALKLTAAPDGTLYASGNRSAAVSGKAFVRFSRDHGTNWTVSDPWAGQTNTFLALDLGAGNSGVVYVCGDILGGGKWVIRKGQQTSSGLVWTTVDTFAGVQPSSIAIRPAPAGEPDFIVVCGHASSPWTVRRSADGGATWATIEANGLGTAYSVAADTNGDLYVDGAITTNIITATNVITTIVHHQKVVTTNYTTTSESGWLVQKSTDGGASWTSVDFALNGRPAYARSLMVDALGRVLAVGYLNMTPYNTWLVRGSADGGATWITTDTFLPAGYTSVAFGAASDALGNVCVIGDVENGTPSADLAPIRRLAAP